MYMGTYEYLYFEKQWVHKVDLLILAKLNWTKADIIVF